MTGGGGWPEVWGLSLHRARVAGSLGGVLPVRSAAELIQLIRKGGVFACSCRFFFVLCYSLFLQKSTQDISLLRIFHSNHTVLHSH